MVCLYHAAQVNRRIKPVAHQQTQFMKDSVKQKVQKKARSEVKVNLPALKLSTTSAWLPLKALLLHIKHVNWAVFQPLCLVRSRLKMFFWCRCCRIFWGNISGRMFDYFKWNVSHFGHNTNELKIPEVVQSVKERRDAGSFLFSSKRGIKQIMAMEMIILTFRMTILESK